MQHAILIRLSLFSTTLDAHAEARWNVVSTNRNLFVLKIPTVLHLNWVYSHQNNSCFEASFHFIYHVLQSAIGFNHCMPWGKALPEVMASAWGTSSHGPETCGRCRWCSPMLPKTVIISDNGGSSVQSACTNLWHPHGKWRHAWQIANHGCEQDCQRDEPAGQSMKLQLRAV